MNEIYNDIHLVALLGLENHFESLINRNGNRILGLGTRTIYIYIYIFIVPYLSLLCCFIVDSLRLQQTKNPIRFKELRIVEEIL